MAKGCLWVALNLLFSYRKTDEKTTLALSISYLENKEY